MKSKTPILVDDSLLVRLDARPTLRVYISELTARKSFILADAASKSFSTGRDMLLGRIWLILDPLLQVLLYAFIFGVVIDTSRGIENFPGFLALGVIFFRNATRGLNSGANLVQRSRQLISSFHFPRAAIVISTTLKDAYDAIVPAVVAVLVALALQMEEPITWHLLEVIPLFVLIQFFCLGCSFCVARLTALIPDFKTPITLFTRALFFLSGIFFTLDRWEGNAALSLAMELNPIYQILHAVRSAVLDGATVGLWNWIYIAGWSLGLTVIGLVYFWRAEDRYANVK